MSDLCPWATCSSFQPRCTTPCNSNCADGTCHQNETCIQGCKLNTWGSDCGQTCSTNCKHALDNTMSSCDRQGLCLFGCQANFTGIFCNGTGQYIVNAFLPLFYINKQKIVSHFCYHCFSVLVTHICCGGDDTSMQNKIQVNGFITGYVQWRLSLRLQEVQFLCTCFEKQVHCGKSDI